MANRTASVMSKPTENSMPRRRRALRKPCEVPAESARASMGTPLTGSRPSGATGNCASAASRTPTWSSAVLAPALPGRRMAARASEVLSSQQPSGWNPYPFLYVGAARSLSEWASSRVASKSRVTEPSVVTGFRPAAQTALRTSARATRMAASSSSSTASTTRNAVGTDATAPKTCGWWRSVTRFERASPPPAMVTARSTSTRPGSWRRRRLHIGASAADKAPVSPESSAISASRRVPACEATPLPSAVTFNGGRDLVAFTWNVPSCLGMLESRNPIFPGQGGFFADLRATNVPANETGGLRAPSRNYGDVRTHLHPRSRRCSSLAYLPGTRRSSRLGLGAQDALSASPYFRSGALRAVGVNARPRVSWFLASGAAFNRRRQGRRPGRQRRSHSRRRGRRGRRRPRRGDFPLGWPVTLPPARSSRSTTAPHHPVGHREDSPPALSAIDGIDLVDVQAVGVVCYKLHPPVNWPATTLSVR